MTSLAGYRTLAKRDFTFSQFGAFGIGGAEKIKLTRRPIRRLFFVGASPLKFMDMEIITTKPAAEREAVTVTLRYFTVFWRELVVDTQMAQQHFFADEYSEVSPQRLWVRRPKGAVFTLIELARNPTEERIGVEGRLKLSAVHRQPEEPLNIETCRDRVLLEMRLHQAREAADRGTGRRVLARLIYLWQLPEHQQALEVLDDADRLMHVGFSHNNIARFTKTNNVNLKYEALFAKPATLDLPLSKWLTHEIALLAQMVQNTGADRIEVTNGNNYMERHTVATLVAKLCGLKLTVGKGLGNDVNSHLGWINSKEIEKFLALSS